MNVMTTEDLAPSTAPVRHAASRLRAVLSGSFRRDVAGLQASYAVLTETVELLSPARLDFVNPVAEFVRLAEEVNESAEDIENRHLLAIAHSDFVWLHAPNGYVGVSTALEIGHARAIGVPVFSANQPSDEMLASYVQVVTSPADVATRLEPTPGAALTGLQAYYGRIAERRGWAQESPVETMLLLTEELGELAREVRRARNLARHQDYDGSLGNEIADVQLYLVHLANSMGIDISDAVTEKERVNRERFEAKNRTEVA